MHYKVKEKKFKDKSYFICTSIVVLPHQFFGNLAADEQGGGVFFYHLTAILFLMSSVSLAVDSN